MSVTLRLLPFQVSPGPENMAADESMLASAADGVLSLRFYGWSSPTLSLGYFQPAEVRNSNPKLQPLSWVRRASGGAALVHHHELTYALALPAGLANRPRSELPWTCRMHQVIARALQRHSVTATSVVCGQERKLGEVLCFLDQTPGDLLVAGSKVVGSAQRKQKGAILQHGGILLKQSEHAPELPGIRELSGVVIDPDTLCQSIVEELANETGWEILQGQWAVAELAEASRHLAERYTADAWNLKR